MEHQSKEKDNNVLHTEVAKHESDYSEALKNDEEFSVLKDHKEKIKGLKKRLLKNGGNANGLEAE